MSYKELLELSSQAAGEHFLKGTSYFNVDLPKYFNFENVLSEVWSAMKNTQFSDISDAKKSHEVSGVNYRLLTNKDGRYAWRPYELIHPLLYVEIVRIITGEENWKSLTDRYRKFKKSSVECCSVPIVSTDTESDKAASIERWWEEVEQKSIELALEFDHLLQTDVTDCYGSMYTHSIPWSIHGLESSKKAKTNKNLIGNQIDFLIRAGRQGQTNGIAQGSELMDFIAELVLGYIDEEVTAQIKLTEITEFKILRFRDDYRIFTNNDRDAEAILRLISEQLLLVGLKLNASKTLASKDIVLNSMKPDKIAGLELRPFDEASKFKLQKQLTKLCIFGKKHPNSGELRRSLGDLNAKFVKGEVESNSAVPEIAIVVDIALKSPRTLPAAASILSKLFSLNFAGKTECWQSVVKKLRTLPNNALVEIWLQRVALANSSELSFESKDKLCKVASKQPVQLWNNTWISSKKLRSKIGTSKILDIDPSKLPQVIQLDEIDLFIRDRY